MKSSIKVSIIIIFLSLFAHAARADEVFTWQDCIQEAAKNHPDLIAAQEEVKQSEAAKKITASTLLPQVNANAAATTARNDTDIVHSSGDTYTYGVSGTQLLFDGAQTINNVRAASENIKASQQSYRFTSTEVRLRLRTAFINLLTAQELIKVTQDIVKIRRDNLELITLRYQSWLEHRGALLTAEANLASAEFQLAQAKRDLELAQRQITKEMGRKEFVPMSVKGDFKVADTANPKPDLEALAKSNPSLLQIAAQKNAAEFNLRSTYGSFFPTLSGQAGAGKSGTHWTPRGDEWNLGLTLSLPVFEGGLRHAQVAQAAALLKQLRENERSTRDGIIVNLEQAWVSLQDAVQTVGVQYKNLVATEERSKIAEVEFSTGFLTYDNWTIIEDNLVSAKTSYLNAQSNALLAEAGWVQAKGETLEYAKK
ncbi:MAG: TolC family protein [Candidatus Omnitrophica bacterium]|nr:TolC family protein [Candidatus Omnitrophota bacterium]